MNEVALKLVTGELLMCTLVRSDAERITIANPIEVSTVQLQRNGDLIERTTSTEWCTITAAQEYTIARTQIIFIEQLKESIAQHYRKLIAVSSISEADQVVHDIAPHQLHDPSLMLH